MGGSNLYTGTLDLLILRAQLDHQAAGWNEHAEAVAVVHESSRG